MKHFYNKCKEKIKKSSQFPLELRQGISGEKIVQVYIE